MNDLKQVEKYFQMKLEQSHNDPYYSTRDINYKTALERMRAYAALKAILKESDRQIKALKKENEAQHESLQVMGMMLEGAKKEIKALKKEKPMNEDNP